MTVIGKWLDPYMYIHVHVTIPKHFQYLLVNEYKKQYRYLVQMVAIAVVRFLLISAVQFCKVSRNFIMSIHVCVYMYANLINICEWFEETLHWKPERVLASVAC